MRSYTLTNLDMTRIESQDNPVVFYLIKKFCEAVSYNLEQECIISAFVQLCD